MRIERNIRLLSWFNFFLDFAPYDPVAVIYFTMVTGSFALGLSVLSIATISSSFFEVPTGILSDAIGRKKTLMLGSIAGAAAITCYAIGGSFLMLAGGAVLAGLAKSFYSGNNEALLYESLGEEKQREDYGTFLGKTSMMFQVGLGTSALIGGFIANYSLVWVMWLSVIPQLVCVALSFFFTEPRTHGGESTNIFNHLDEAIGKFQINKKLRTLSVVSIVGFGLEETVHQFKPVFVALFWPIWAVGLARMLGHIFAALGHWFSGALMKKFQPLKLLIISDSASRGINIIAFGIPTVLSPLLSSVTSFFFGFKSVAQNTLLQLEFSDRQRATMGSINAFFGSMFTAGCMLLFGLIADHLSPAKTLLIAEIALVPIILVYWKLFRTHG